ncbi:RNA-directed DNA polymerase from mobile element jockey [Eumeta japonica]|uniref:RNA-directed DNA polymerase from mobile element jockey n=1 Tax=Eumeta variegata TaxID=151549 RepID=A0A4C1W8G2_EUMVA|nr:RNA-directed DNA polymerase from mobile element jockey [Eumeta japonica]
MCATTHVVHLESVNNLNTDSAIISVDRMMACHGCSEVVIGDNGSAFYEADNEFLQRFNEMYQNLQNLFQALPILVFTSFCIWLLGAKISPNGYPLPPALTRVIVSFIHQRSFCVVVDEALSAASRLIRAGVAQGSYLSPSLYATFTDDITTLRDLLED